MDTSSHDEIDLQELAVRIIRYFKKHLMFIVISCAAGIALGVGTYEALPNIYQSQMVVLSDLLTKSYGDRIDESLNNLIGEGNHEELSARLNMPKDQVASITSIQVECITDLKSPQRDKIEKDETFFIVTVKLLDRSILPGLQEGLLYFFRNNEYVRIRARQREELGNAVIENIGRELRFVDSLKLLLFKSQPFKGENLMFDPATLFTTSVDLTKLQWKTKHEVELANSIHLVEGFTAFQKPKDPKLVVLMLIGLSLGFIISISLLTLKHLFNLARS